MFKVGDKGKTRDGLLYVILSVTDDFIYMNKYPQPILAGVEGEGIQHFSPCGSYNPDDGDTVLDLMPPEREETSENADHECELSTEHGHDTLLDELADIACRHGIPVEYDIDSGVITFNRYA